MAQEQYTKDYSKSAEVQGSTDTKGEQRFPSKDERSVASDLAQERSIITGKVLLEKGLAPLVIVRGHDSGVSIGYLGEYSEGVPTLLEVRKLWNWRNSGRVLYEVAANGITSGRLSDPAPLPVPILDACEIIPVGPKAIESLTTSRWDP